MTTEAERIETAAYAIEKFAIQKLSDWNYSFSTSEKLAQAAIAADPVTEDVKRWVGLLGRALDAIYGNYHTGAHADSGCEECITYNDIQNELKKWSGE